MAISNLRLAIASAYPGKRWKEKCETMPDNQVVAIYNHFVRDGVFNKIRTPKRKEDPDYHQMTIFDYGVARR